VCLTAPSSSAQSSPLQDFELELAMRQRVNGKLEEAVHLVQLSCERGECQLTSVTLNQCFLGAFYPKLERASTRDGSLSVSMTGGVIVARETGWALGQYTTTFRFNVKRRGPNARSLMVTAFSGAYVKDSTELGKVITSDYIAVQNGGETLSLACPVMLPGVVPESPAKSAPSPPRNCRSNSDCVGSDVCLGQVCVLPRK
jgi:hypothetical protein